MRFLLDTDVISELGKGRRADPHVAAWYAAANPDDLCTSALVIGEIRAGVERLRGGQAERAAAFERSLVLVVDLFADRILGIDRRIAERWGVLAARRGVPAVDGLIGATALVHGMVVVTRNERDFERTGVEVLNPFKPND